MKATNRYLSGVHVFPHLTRRQELVLARKAALGHEDAIARLILANLRLVALVASEYRNCGLPQEDLMSEGCLGLIHAIPRFEPARGLRFFSYASFWVRKAMLRALAYQVPLVPVSAYHRTRQRNGPDAARNPLLLRRVSIDEAPDGDGKPALADQMADEASDSPETLAIRREAILRLRRAMVHLSPRDRNVVEMRFGLSGGKAATLLEVSRRLGVSRERVRQIEMRARDLLRRELGRAPGHRSVA